MDMFRKMLDSVSPCSLVLCAFPIYALALPDGVPFAFSGCGSGLVGSPSIIQNTCTLCTLNGNTIAKATSCTVSVTGNHCTLHVDNASVEILDNGPNAPPNCGVQWSKECLGTPVDSCGGGTVGTGIGTYTYSGSQPCDNNQKDPFIKLQINGACAPCTPPEFLKVRADFANCN